MTATLDDLQVLMQRILDDLPQIIERAKLTGNQVQVQTLSQISAALGLIRAGEFRSGNNQEPGSGFSGIRIGYPPFWYGGRWWNIVGVNNDSLQFGLRADDGVGTFASQQITMDADAMKIVGLLYGIQHTASNLNVSRIGKVGMIVPSGMNTPAYQFAFEDAGSHANLLVNGNAETGDLTGWTDVSSAWTVSSIIKNSGAYSFFHPLGLGCPAYLSQAVSGLSPSTYYGIKFTYKNGNAVFSPSVSIIWKDGGGSIIQTDVVTGTDTTSFTTKSVVLKSPINTASAVIQFNPGDSFSETYVDDIQFFPSGIAMSLYFSDIGLKLVGASLIIGDAALSTTATDGFIYVPTCAGIPTGVPTTNSGVVPIVYDTIDNKLYIYNGGWKSATFA